MNPLKILLIESESISETLAPVLVNFGYTVINASSAKVPLYQLADDNQPGLIAFNIKSPKAYLADIQQLIQKLAIPVIIFATDDNLETINLVVKAGVSAYVVDGLENHRLNSIIHIALARFKEQQELKEELEKTKSKLEERKLTDRAKGILIKTRGFSEDEAYHTLRKLAMDRNISIAEMSKNVISMAELLK